MTALAPVTVTEKAGPMSGKEATDWTFGQIPYTNRASEKPVAERAIKHVNELIAIFQGAVRPIQLRYRILDVLLAGNAIEKHQNDTHIPELYKSREAVVPRVEQIFFARKPWFVGIPHEKTATSIAEANAAYIEWQLDQANFRSRIPGYIEDAWTYQQCIAKWSWERRVVEMIQKRIETKFGPDSIEYKIYRTKADEVVFDGPLDRPVNPYWFIIDPRVTSIREAAFVGDESEWLYRDLERWQELGFFQNVEKLKDTENNNAPMGMDQGMADQLRFSQNPTARYNMTINSAHVKGARKYKLRELWCLFDLNDDGNLKECVLTIADGRVCLRAQENPLDGKYRPYSACRAARTAHSWFGTGPMDNAVRLQIDYDRYSAIALRIAKLIANPITFVQEDVDLPNSLHLLPEGAILKGVGKVDFTRMPNTLELISFMFQHFERQIAETTGVPKILEANPSGADTATGDQILQEEGNRRIQGFAARFGGFLEDGLEIIKRLNKQFLTKKASFPVMGKRSRLIGDFASVSPNTLLENVTYRTSGIEGIQSYGMQFNRLNQILANNMPLVQLNSSQINTLGWLHKQIALGVSQEVADELVNVPRDPMTLTTQEEENQLLMEGFAVPVDPDDNDDEHIAGMAPIKGYIHNSQTNKDVRTNIAQHLADHLKNQEQKRVAAQVTAQRQAAQQAAMPQSAGNEPGNGSASPIAGGPATPPGQQPDQNPGPTDASKFGRAGRQGPTMQDQTQPSEYP